MISVTEYFEAMDMIKLQSADGENFEVEVAVAKQSMIIKTMLEDLGMDDKDDDQPVPLPNVEGRILRKVLEWCTRHKDEKFPADDTDCEVRSNELEEWDQKFVMVDQGTLFEIILAANYLDIKGLLDMGCKSVANMMKGKSAEEIRTTFNIKNDFTPEEEEQLRQENDWAEQ